MPDSRLIPYFQLARPANILTAIADIWAGFAVVISPLGLTFFGTDFSPTLLQQLIWLSFSTIGLYGGGVAFNDVFDANLDSTERPERPIPSGRVPLKNAALFASILLILGIFSAFQVNLVSGMIAVSIATLALVYDYWGKHQFFLGPINMGLCRSGNLLLGISAFPELLKTYWFLGIIPLIFVAAITMISRGEVNGKNKNALMGGLGMYFLIFISILFLAFSNGRLAWQVLPFLALFAYMIFPPLIKAIHLQLPMWIGKAVKAAVISLIILNASLASIFAGWEIGVLVLLLLPLSLWLAGKFAVT
jgi:4-hydroxybenzoate polyprenyltransferase